MGEESTPPASLDEALRRRHRELDAITTMVETVASTLDLNEVVTRTLDAVTGVLGVSSGGIYLRDEQGQVRQSIARALTDDQPGGGVPAAAVLALAGHVMHRGEPTLHQFESPTAEAAASSSLAAAPLFSKGAILGVIVISESTRLLAESDLQLLARLARHAGMAISNAALYRDLQQAYQALQTAQEQLMEAERQKIAMQMAGAAAHELNQPLTVVVGYSSILARTIKPDDPKFPVVEKIERNAQKMNEIVKRLGQLTQYKTREYLHGEEIVDIREEDDDEL